MPPGGYAIPEHENLSSDSSPAAAPVDAAAAPQRRRDQPAAAETRPSLFPGTLQPAAPLPLLLKPELARRLSADSRGALRAAKIDLASTSLPLAVDMLDRQIAAATTQLLQLTEMPPQSLIQVGQEGQTASGGAGVLLEKLDRIADGQDVLGSIVRDLAPELLLERHHQFDRIKAVSAEIVDKAGVLRDLVGLDAKMLNHDLLHALCDIAHRLPSCPC